MRAFNMSQGEHMAKVEKNGLTAKQEAYARERASGKTQRQAYISAYADKGGLPETKDSEASRIESNRKVNARIAELRQKAREGAIYDADSIQGLLTEMIDDAGTSKGIRLKALDMLNRMQGTYTERHDISIYGLSRSDRVQAMHDSLSALKDTWD